MIKKLNINNKEALFNVEKSAFSHPWSEKMLEEELKNKNAHYFGYFSDDKMVGYIGFIKALDEGQITNVAVIPNYQRNGIGKQLIDYIKSIANEFEINFYSLEVRESNIGAINLYKKCGFSEVGARKNYYPDNRETAILMDLNINI